MHRTAWTACCAVLESHIGKIEISGKHHVDMIKFAQEDITMRPVERATRRALHGLDAAANRLYGAAWNPLYQSGTIAVAMLVTLVVTGLYLVFVYRVGDPAA